MLDDAAETFRRKQILFSVVVFAAVIEKNSQLRKIASFLHVSHNYLQNFKILVVYYTVGSVKIRICFVKH